VWGEAFAGQMTVNGDAPRRGHTSRKFGSLSRARCIVCARVMRLVKTEAHPLCGAKHEMQTYTCRRGASVQITVPTPGDDEG
jgi:hypothetical protein